MLIGFLGVGKLIKYIPYPVVSGYLSGVGLVIIGSQLPNFAGAPSGSLWFQVLTNPQTWDLRGLAVGAVTVVTMLGAPKMTKAIPGTIVGIVAGILTYAGIAAVDPALRVLDGNSLVIGPLGATGDGYVQLITDRWDQIGELKLSQVAALIGSAITLAALLSIDTLKTCVVLDQMTRTRHDPNRELAAQGLANVVASSIGGMPGAGTMGASMVNLSSGGETRISGIIEGVMSLVVALLLGAFVAWIPIAALSGVLIVVGLRMIDTDPLRFLESRATVLDFSVVLAVRRRGAFGRSDRGVRRWELCSRSSCSCVNRWAGMSSGARVSSVNVRRPGSGPRPRCIGWNRRETRRSFSSCRGAFSSVRRINSI